MVGTRVDYICIILGVFNVCVIAMLMVMMYCSDDLSESLFSGCQYGLEYQGK